MMDGGLGFCGLYSGLGRGFGGERMAGMDTGGGLGMEFWEFFGSVGFGWPLWVLFD